MICVVTFFFAVVVDVVTEFTRERKCDGNVGEAVKQEEKLCDEVETVRELTYIGDRVSAGGGCEVAVIVRTRCGWIKFRRYGEMLYGRRFPLRLRGAVYESYVRPTMLYGSEAWCLKKNENGNFMKDRKIHDESNMWSAEKALRISCSCWV